MHRPDRISTILTIAGSDCSGGAGIQADIKTADAFKVYASSAVTAITVQNPFGVKSVEALSSNLVAAQIDAVYECMTPEAVKIGMLPSTAIVEVVAQRLSELNAVNIVVDPVLAASTGESLSGITSDTLEAMKMVLFPKATLITPNYHEAGIILGNIENPEPEVLAKTLRDNTGAAAVLVKGGHFGDHYCTDVLFNGYEITRYRQVRIDSRNTHGTGCVLSSAIACGLAKGLHLTNAVRIAKNFISHAIDMGKDLHIVSGRGPLYIFS